MLISGPKLCGKPTTSEKFAKSSIKLNTHHIIQLARLKPRNILVGEQPRLIDEWQTVPDIWNVAKEWIEEGAANMLKLKADIKSNQEPSFMMVLTGTGAAYRRKDGVLVVPINCLKE